MPNHHDIYDLFNSIDDDPELWRFQLGDWQAWPMIKMQLLWQLLAVHPTGTRPTDMPRIGAKIVARLAALPRILTHMLSRDTCSGAPVLLMASPYGHTRDDGTVEDRFFGALTPDAFPFPFDVMQAPKDGADLNELGARIFLAEILALIQMWMPSVRRPADSIARILISHGLPLPSRTIHRKARLALALFEARRRLFKPLFKRCAPKVLVLTYAPGRMGEVAAAREQGIDVIELQHGMFGPTSSDYHWPAGTLRARLPFPDLLAVFGPFFQDTLLAGGFWPAETVRVIGAAPIDRFQAQNKPPHMPGDPFRLLFLTQPASSSAAISFFTEVLTYLNNIKREDVHLSLKLHHQDNAKTSPYHALAQAYPDRVSILDKDYDPLTAMFEADAVASYNSLGLAEACAIGTPPISIMGGVTPGGFARSFDGEDMKKAIPHVKTPEALIATIDTLRTKAGGPDAPSNFDALNVLGQRFFTPGFLEKFPSLVAERLNPTAPTTS